MSIELLSALRSLINNPLLIRRMSEYSSNVQPFDDDDMYGSDHGMDIVSELSENEEVAEILEGPEERVVSAGECPIMSEDLTLNRMIVSFSCFRRCTQIQKTC
jgi:hypothetical protein